MDTSARPVPCEQVISQAAPGALVVFHLESGEYYSLDEIGSRIWELCDGSRTLSEITDVLCGEYDAPWTSVHADVLELVGTLEKEGLMDAGSRTTSQPAEDRES